MIRRARGSISAGYRAVGVEARCARRSPRRWCYSRATAERIPSATRSAVRGRSPIEAALIAKNRAPGLDRSFDAQKWAFLPSRIWMDAADEAMDQEFHSSYDIWGGDIDPRAIDIARDNARQGGRGGHGAL